MLEFFRKHVAASLIGAVGVVLAAIGYADQAGTIITTFQPWQLQASGAGLFVVFVVQVLASYDKAHATQASSEVSTIEASPTEEPRALSPSQDHSAIPEASILPQAVTSELINLFCSNPTELQLRKMMKPYDGKWMIFEMHLRNLSERNEDIAALMEYIDKKKSSDLVWVYFDKQWEDHLHTVAKGGKIRLKARISVGNSGKPTFVDAIPML